MPNSLLSSVKQYNITLVAFFSTFDTDEAKATKIFPTLG